MPESTKITSDSPMGPFLRLVPGWRTTLPTRKTTVVFSTMSLVNWAIFPTSSTCRPAVFQFMAGDHVENLSISKAKMTQILQNDIGWIKGGTRKHPKIKRKSTASSKLALVEKKQNENKWDFRISSGKQQLVNTKPASSPWQCQAGAHSWWDRASPEIPKCLRW